MNIPEMLIQSVGLAALNATVRPGVLEPWIAQIEETVQRDGQFTKVQVLYFTASPPPFFWNYQCARCRAYVTDKNDPAKAGTCRWVRGDISPVGWCSIWVPRPEDEQTPFAWVRTIPDDAQFTAKAFLVNIENGPLGKVQ